MSDEKPEDPRDPYHDGIRDALEEVRLLVDELPDGPHVLALEAKIDELEQRMTGATEPPAEDSISIRIGRGAAAGLSRLLGDPSSWIYAAAQGIAMHSFMRDGERFAREAASRGPCGVCPHGELVHKRDPNGIRGACGAKDCTCAVYVARHAPVKP